MMFTDIEKFGNIKKQLIEANFITTSLIGYCRNDVEINTDIRSELLIGLSVLEGILNNMKEIVVTKES